MDEHEIARRIRALPDQFATRAGLGRRGDWAWIRAASFGVSKASIERETAH